MGTILADKVNANTGGLLLDTGFNRYGEEELTSYLDDGQRDIVKRKPNANATISSWVLVAGIEQSLPALGIQLIRLICNMSTDGSTIGNAVSPADLDTYSRVCPNWTTQTASATVSKYFFDEQVPDKFLTYPPQPASGFGYIKGAYSTLVADITKVGSGDLTPDPAAVINLDDFYSPALAFYSAYRAMAKDAEDPSNMEMANWFWQQYLQAIQSKEATEAKYNPNIVVPPIRM